MARPDLVKEEWAKTQTEIIRFEQRREYHIPHNLTLYRDFFQGEQPSPKDAKVELYATVAATVRRGVAVKRIRVFDVPLSDRQQAEIESAYLTGEEFGLQALVLPRPVFTELVIKRGFSEIDFWAFDRQQFLTVEYDQRGDYRGEVPVATDFERLMLQQQLLAILQRSIPPKDFLLQL
ncbi:MAG: hypothetical protein HY420_00625 [Candidatus Kerfeldbacteria bacterium]|nr:hypothetical protein [Candidatus Kerfeldbacteria bacterium]